MLMQIPHASSREGDAARLRAAGARRIRRRRCVPAARPRGAQNRRRHHREVDRRRGPDVPRLARRAGRPLRARRKRQADRAGDPPDLHRPRRRIADDRCLRAEALRHPQGRSRTRLGLGDPRDRRLLSRVAVDAHDRLQGHAARRASSAHYYKRPADPRLEIGPRAGASALLDQHLPVLVAGASLPHGRPQRRDQHAARQRQLDGGAAGIRSPPSCSAPTSRKLWPISYEGQSDTACFDNALEFLVAGRLFARPCDDDADPGGLGRQSADGRGAPRLLRISRRADGAVGRPGGDRLHRRPPDRRHPRPQRPAARRATSSPTTISS